MAIRLPIGLSQGQALTATREGGLNVRVFWDGIGHVWTGPLGLTGKLLTLPSSVVQGLQLTDDQWTAEFIARYSLAESQAEQDIGSLFWAKLDDVRKSAATDIAYQQGGAGLAGYHKMIAAIQRQDWVTAEAECIDSEAEKETPRRCTENSKMFLTGQWPQ